MDTGDFGIHGSLPVQVERVISLRIESSEILFLHLHGGTLLAVPD